MIPASGCLRCSWKCSCLYSKSLFFHTPTLLSWRALLFWFSLLRYFLQIDCSFWLRLASVGCIEKKQTVIPFFSKHASSCQPLNGYDDKLLNIFCYLYKHVRDTIVSWDPALLQCLVWNILEHTDFSHQHKANQYPITDQNWLYLINGLGIGGRELR